MKETFQAVHPAELESFLSRLGLLDRFNKGTIKCHWCADLITKDNFKALTRRGDRILFSCNKGTCLLSLATGEGEK